MSQTRNLLALSSVELFWGFGLQLVSMATVIPVFLEGLGASSAIIALVPALAALGAATTQLFSGTIGKPWRPLKGWVLWLHVASPLPLLFTAAWLWATGRWAVPAVLAFWGLFYAGLGLLFPLWMEYMARILDPARRGRAFGLIFLVQTLMGAVGASAASALLARGNSSRGTYALLFLLASLCMAGGSLFFAFTRGERLSAVPEEHQHLGVFRRLRAVAAASPWFKGYLAARWLVRGSYPLLVSFFAVEAVRRGEATPALAALFGTVFLVAQASASFLWGLVADRWGQKIPILLGHGMLAAAAVLMLLPLPTLGYFVVAALCGAFMYTEFVGQSAWLMDLAPASGRQDLLALAGSSLAPAAVAAPILGGFAMDRFGYAAVAATVAGCAAIAFLILWSRVPSKRPTP